MESDEELLRRTANGDQTAAAELYDRHAPEVLRSLTLLLGDGHAAEDALQNAFAYLFTRAGEYDPRRATVRLWTLRLARNFALNELRRRERKPALSLETLVPAGGGLVPLREALAAPEAAPDREDAAFAVELLGRLSDEDRETVILRHVQGLDVADIAAIQDSTPKAVSMRLWRAMGRLRALLPRAEDSV